MSSFPKNVNSAENSQKSVFLANYSQEMVVQTQGDKEGDKMDPERGRGEEGSDHKKEMAI